jgi:hypothetical protein
MTTILGLLSIVAIAAAIVLVVQLARAGRLRPQVLVGLAVVCAVGLFFMIITDWPTEALSEFWRDHSVVSATATAVLLVGIGFLAFEAVDMHHQELLNNSLTAAGLGGLVDHLVDIDITLSLVQRGSPPDDQRWPGWGQADKPLRWLRADRELLARGTEGEPRPGDPRADQPPVVLPETDIAWRLDLVNEAVRRAMAAMRDWSPVLGRSRLGLRILIKLGGLRMRLLELAESLQDGDLSKAARHLWALRVECSDMALNMEYASGVRSPRPEVLTAPVTGTAWTVPSANDRTVRQKEARRRLLEHS